jgi:hypothetical protein
VFLSTNRASTRDKREATLRTPGHPEWSERGLRGLGLYAASGMKDETLWLERMEGIFAPDGAPPERVQEGLKALKARLLAQQAESMRLWQEHLKKRRPQAVATAPPEPDPVRAFQEDLLERLGGLTGPAG